MTTNTKKTVGLCTMEKFDNRPVNTVGSSRIRARWLLPYWEEAEEFVIGQDYDVLIYQKVYWLEMMRSSKAIQIIDICDPDWLEKKPVFQFMDLADAVVTSSQELADYIKRIRPDKKEVICIPDRIYLPEHNTIKQDYSGTGKKAVWFGYSQNTHYLQKTLENLILKGIELTVISDQPYNPPYAYRKLKVTNLPYDYSVLHKEIIKHDFVLMPKPDDDMKGKFKSNNKTLTCWALGMPVASMPEDLDKFAKQENREEEGKKRLQEVKDKSDVKHSVKEYKQLIERLKNGR